MKKIKIKKLKNNSFDVWVQGYTSEYEGEEFLISESNWEHLCYLQRKFLEAKSKLENKIDSIYYGGHSE